MSFMLALPKISFHGAGAIGDMVKQITGKKWGKALGANTQGMSEEQASRQAIEAISALSARVGIPSGFSQLGIKTSDIEGWLYKALADPCAPCNPRVASREEVRALYLEAL
ncbi:iron-containing alcohol dehydrogenase [Brenneria goodwinii]|nr:iron-containing alcohol dehydrogenase [Brenneria goodwinii]MCG8161679.1 iron-containing alcohol dehydrogenase [Brenneria goodwinii]MCG8166687.1 iron-containing alcohol dehydrogenase [Brenneria goodwinii]MCG8171355.1 iron-containing alcohol dehydrogenase [Brenneria goodwinii]MCG8175438.1 iron-containing alcohol dehydrogenase [Brenneria goodwinii]